MPHRLIPAVLPYVGTGLAVLAGSMIAQAPGGPRVPVGGDVTVSPGVAGAIVALTGFVMHVGSIYIQWLDRRRADLNLEGKNKELKSRLDLQAAELDRLRAAADQAKEVAEANKARVAGVQGSQEGLIETQEGLIETLQSSGVVDVPGGPHDRHGRRSTMLIVEDDAATARQLMRLFTKLGFYATHAATVDDAMAVLGTVGKQPHWMILDLKLGERDGMEVLRYVRGAGLSPPRVAVITGEDEPGRLAEVEALHPELLLIKPIPFRDLVSLINPEVTPPEGGEVVH